MDSELDPLSHPIRVMKVNSSGSRSSQRRKRTLTRSDRPSTVDPDLDHLGCGPVDKRRIVDPDPDHLGHVNEDRPQTSDAYPDDISNKTDPDPDHLGCPVDTGRK